MLSLSQGAHIASKFACVLKFTSKEVDPSTGEPEEDGYEDEYTLEDVDVNMLDFVRAAPIPNFRKVRELSPSPLVFVITSKQLVMTINFYLPLPFSGLGGVAT